MTDYKYKEITEKIIGLSMKVHAALGNGFQQVFYQIRKRRVDFFVKEKIMVERKAIIQLENVHLAQAKNYLEAYNIQVGLLINFGSISLQFKRLENKKFVGNPFPLNQ